MTYWFIKGFFHPRTGLTGKNDFARPLSDIPESDDALIPAVPTENISSPAASR